VYEGGGASFNPIQAFEGIARIQNMQNQNRLFQQEFAARTRLGEIMATSPDAETGFNRAMQDPLAAPFATQQFAQFREGMLSQAKYSEILGNQASSALESVLKATPIGIMDPKQYQGYLEARFALLPDAVQARAKPAFDMYKTSLFGGLDNMTPEQAGAELQHRFASIGIGSGAITPDTIRGIYGVPAPSVQVIKTPDGREIPVSMQQPLFGGPSTLVPPNVAGGQSNQLAVPQAVPVPGGGSLSQPPGGGSSGLPVAGQPSQPGGVAPGIGQTTSQAKTAEQEAQYVTDIQKEIDASASAMPTIANRINALQDTVRSFPAGGWASSRANLASWIQGAGHAFGVKPEIVDKWTNDIIGAKDDQLGGLAAQQIFHALVGQYAIEELKKVAQGTGRVMQMEVVNAMTSISENLDPRAIEYILNTQARPSLQRAADKLNKWIPFKRAAEAGQITGSSVVNGNPMTFTYKPADFFSWYDREQQGDLPTRFGTVGGGIPIGPRDPAEAIGGAPGARRVYIQPSGGMTLTPPSAQRPAPRSEPPPAGGTTGGSDIPP